MAKQYIFTMVFGLLLIYPYAKPPKTSYFVGKSDGNLIQINNPQVVNKKQFCITNVTINGKKIKTDYKIGGVEIDLTAYGFEEGTELLVTITHKNDCEPTFHSAGFKSQKD